MKFFPKLTYTVRLETAPTILGNLDNERALRVKRGEAWDLVRQNHGMKSVKCLQFFSKYVKQHLVWIPDLPIQYGCLCGTTLAAVWQSDGCSALAA